MPEKEKEEVEEEASIEEPDLGKIGDMDPDKLMKLAMIKKITEGGKDMMKYFLLREILK